MGGQGRGGGGWVVILGSGLWGVVGGGLCGVIEGASARAAGWVAAYLLPQAHPCRLMRTVMQRPRRQFLQLAAAAALSALPRPAWAQAYPARPVRLVVGTAAGCVQDILSRVIAQWLAEQLGQPFVIDNRVGGGDQHRHRGGRARAGGRLHAALDRTVVGGQRDALSEAQLQLHPRHRPGRQHGAPVAGRGGQSVVPVKTMAEFVAYTKANPGKVNFASSGVGTGNQLAVELFKMVAGVDMVHVPYRGRRAGDDRPDRRAGGGDVRLAGGGDGAHQERQAAGARRDHVKRDDLLPDLAPVADMVRGYESSPWFGIGAPHGTPPESSNAQQGRQCRARRSQDAGALYRAGGGIVASSPAAFGKLIADETEKWGKVVKFAGLKPS